jgi:hypothetical protein
MKHAWERCERHTTFWLENLKGRDHVEDKEADRKIILEWIFRKLDGKLWTGFICLRLGTSVGPL